MASDGQYCELVGARVTNFGCFADSGFVPIDRVTVLLAENENGKTTFLRALAWFSSGEDFDEDDRRIGASDGHIDLVALDFRLSRDARESLKAQGYPDVEALRIVRRSSGVYRTRDTEDNELGGRRQQLEAEFRSARDEVRRLLLAHQPSPVDAPARDVLAKELLSATVGSAPTLASRFLPEVPSLSGSGDLEKFNEASGAMVEAAEAANALSASPYVAVERFLPRLIYFDDQVDLVRDAVTYEEITSDPASNRTMINLASLAGVDLTAVASDRHVRQRISKSASQTLTSGASKYWYGSPVTFQVTFEESAAVVSLEHKGRDQKPTRRSRGLQWFLGFYVNFIAETGGELAGAVLLLDEPGIYLHVKQQPKLLELFDQIAQENQLIYSTQMPYMVPRTRFERLRLLVPEERVEGAVRVEPRVHAVPSSADVLQPLRAAIGVGIADAMSLATMNVVVEGMADVFILSAMSSLARGQGLNSLPDDIAVLPAGGAGKRMLPLASFVAAELTSGVVLVDDDKAGRDAEREIQKAFAGFVPVVRVFDAAAKTPSGQEIEDLVDRAYYLELVNESHRDVAGFSPLNTHDLDEQKPIADAVRAAFGDRGLGAFQKLRPARELQARVISGEGRPPDETIRSFGTLFERLTKAMDPPD